MYTYPLIELEKDIEDIIEELAEIRAKKGHDYSCAEDTLENLRGFGWQGVLVRLGDKFNRLKTFVAKGVTQVEDESIEDTMLDHINYSLFQLIMYREEKARRQEKEVKDDS